MDSIVGIVAAVVAVFFIWMMIRYAKFIHRYPREMHDELNQQGEKEKQEE